MVNQYQKNSFLHLKNDIDVLKFAEDDSQYSEGEGWIHWFCSLEDHHFFCEIEEEYVRDNFNLYGLKERFNHYKYEFFFFKAIFSFLIANVWI